MSPVEQSFAVGWNNGALDAAPQCCSHRCQAVESTVPRLATVATQYVWRRWLRSTSWRRWLRSTSGDSGYAVCLATVATHRKSGAVQLVVDGDNLSVISAAESLKGTDVGPIDVRGVRGFGMLNGLSEECTDPSANTKLAPLYACC